MRTQLYIYTLLTVSLSLEAKDRPRGLESGMDGFCVSRGRQCCGQRAHCSQTLCNSCVRIELVSCQPSLATRCSTLVSFLPESQVMAVAHHELCAFRSSPITSTLSATCSNRQPAEDVPELVIKRITAAPGAGFCEVLSPRSLMREMIGCIFGRAIEFDLVIEQLDGYVIVEPQCSH
jgi:hypothetical protein